MDKKAIITKLDNAIKNDGLITINNITIKFDSYDFTIPDVWKWCLELYYKNIEVASIDIEKIHTIE